MLQFLSRAVELVPEVKAHLSDKAFEVLKSIDTYDRQLWKYALDLYRGGDPGVFITDFVNAISNQLTRAWNEGGREMGIEPKDMTDDDRAEIQAIINAEYEHILDLGTAITAAQQGTLQEFRDIFRPRIDMWVSRYTDVVNQAKIYFGGKTRLIWVEGDTKEKCPTCLALNGIVAFAQEWEQSGVRPQSPPNNAIECGGWNCSCTLQVTDKRRSPLALQRIMDIATSANLEEKSYKYNPSQPRVPAGDSEGGQWVSEFETMTRERFGNEYFLRGVSEKYDGTMMQDTGGKAEPAHVMLWNPNGSWAHQYAINGELLVYRRKDVTDSNDLYSDVIVPDGVKPVFRLPGNILDPYKEILRILNK